MIFTKDIFTSGHHFEEDELDLKSKFQMINIALLLSSIGLLYGIVLHTVRHEGSTLISIESFLLFINALLSVWLYLQKKSLEFVSLMVTIQFTFFFVYLIYISDPSDLKHIWIFTYPIVLLYFQKEGVAAFWIIAIIAMLLVAPFQPFFEVKYTFFQLSYLSFVLATISIIIYFYKKKMDEAKALIEQQQQMLAKKVEELTQKDKILTMQSKQAVMGEMISMIAHQWRQPLSTVTLTISNLQVKKLLGEPIAEKEFDEAITKISDTVVYLSHTIDDFQTYFRPQKELSWVDLNDLVEKTLSLVEPRLKEKQIVIHFTPKEPCMANIYANELVQVLINIVHNAIDELQARHVMDPLISISIEEQDDFFRIAILDNAGGIKSESLEVIFEPYFSTKGKNGTGLGLYMSQMIMQKQFNTEIEVQNSENGALFGIKVPKDLA